MIFRGREKLGRLGGVLGIVLFFKMLVNRFVW